MAQVRARHILVGSESACNDLKSQIEGGADFAEVARQHSSCPSKNNGGDLGEFGPKRMVAEFDKVCFDPATKLGVVYGPVQTRFGYHLIELTARDGETAVVEETVEEVVVEEEVVAEVEEAVEETPSEDKGKGKGKNKE